MNRRGDRSGEPARSSKPVKNKTEKRETRAQRLDAFPDKNEMFGTTWFTWAQEKLRWSPDRCREVFDTFRDHWRAAPGSKGVKADWEATWRNWCRRESSFQKPAPQARGEVRIRETSPEKRASDLSDVAAFEEYKRLSRKYPRLRTDEVWALVGKSDDEIAEIMNQGKQNA